MGTLQSRAASVDVTTLATQWSDEQGNTVKVLHSPYIKKLFVSVTSFAGQGELDEERPVDRVETETWIERNRDFAEPVAAGELLAKRIARVTYETSSGELVRLLLDEADAQGTDPEGGPAPDVEWTERAADRQLINVDVNGVSVDAIARVVYETGPLLVSFTYATEQPLPEPPAAAVQWEEFSRSAALLLVGDTVEVERVVDVTFFRYIYYPGYKVLRFIRFLYEEGQENYTWPDSITVIEPAGGN